MRSCAGSWRELGASGALVGPGDDAAVLVAPDGRVVATTDTLVHGPDFRLAWSSGFDLGWKAAAVNLADIAAMGARPTALLVALAMPNETRSSFVERARRRTPRSVRRARSRLRGRRRRPDRLATRSRSPSPRSARSTAARRCSAPAHGRVTSSPWQAISAWPARGLGDPVRPIHAMPTARRPPSTGRHAVGRDDAVAVDRQLRPRTADRARAPSRPMPAPRL